MPVTTRVLVVLALVASTFTPVVDRVVEPPPAHAAVVGDADGEIHCTNGSEHLGTCKSAKTMYTKVWAFPRTRGDGLARAKVVWDPPGKPAPRTIFTQSAFFSRYDTWRDVPTFHFDCGVGRYTLYVGGYKKHQNSKGQWITMTTGWLYADSIFLTAG